MGYAAERGVDRRGFRDPVEVDARGGVEELGAAVKPDYSDADAPWLYALLERLARDGLVALEGEGETARARLP